MTKVQCIYSMISDGWCYILLFREAAYGSASSLFFPADVVVELERSVYSVPEIGGQVQICAVVNTNNTDCVIGFSFEVLISLNEVTEGILFV